MSEQYVTLRGIDPLLFRDGRPFSDEVGALAAQSLPLPLPGTVAGAIRTRLGNVADWDWHGAGPADALAVSVAGPILLRNGEPVYVAPADAVVHKKPDGSMAVMGLRPYTAGSLPDGAGCDLGDGLIPLRITEDCKPERGYDYWSRADMEAWLLNATGANATPPVSPGQPDRDERVHVAINRQTGVSEDGKLFLTQSICFEQYGRWSKSAPAQRWSILVRVDHTQAGLPGPAPFGGERRLAVIERAADAAWPTCPDPLLTSARSADGILRLRMILATPSIFKGGWKPAWIGADMRGQLHGANLKLVAAAVKRRDPVSGWDYAFATRGAKPVRWMAPAGSVYFFEATGNTAELLRNLWLRPVSDGEQNQRDGYGLALWGLW